MVYRTLVTYMYMYTNYTCLFHANKGESDCSSR